MGIIGWIIALIITIIIVAIAEAVSRTQLPYGWIGNIVAGLIGGWLGQMILGNTWGPSIGGVLIIQTFIGALVLILVVKWLLNRAGSNRV
jgi:uncharacterized membrane protein YeaQ/YmgE (transglycosylase-associated protein family)